MEQAPQKRWSGILYGGLRVDALLTRSASGSPPSNTEERTLETQRVERIIITQVLN